MDLCLICLRSDRRLIRASNTLAKFHEQLCEFSVSTMTCTYCNECHHLLRKFQKFKEKCFKALEVYQNWVLEETSKKRPLNTLCELLPPSSYGIWIQNPLKISDSLIACKIDGDYPTARAPAKLKCNCRPLAKNVEGNGKGNNGKKNNINKSKPKLLHNITNNFHDYTKAVPSDKKRDSTDFDQTPLRNKEKNEVICLEKPPFQSIEIFDDDSDCDWTEYQNIEMLDDETEFDETPHPNIEQMDVQTDIDEKLHKNIEILEKETDFVKSKPQIQTTPKIQTKKFKKPRNTNLKPRNKKSPMQTYKEKLLQARELNNTELKTTFDIEYLVTKKQKTDEFNRRKTYKCYTEAEYKCEICYVPVKNEKYLKYHLDRWHTERGNIKQCEICKVWVKKLSNHNFNAHIALYKCKLCPLLIRNRESAVKHLEWHSKKEYRCEPCGTTYKSRSGYYNHIGRAHRKGVHVCARCGRGFVSAHGLRVHMASQTNRCTAGDGQPTEGGVPCEVCDIKFPSEQVYRTHMYDVHRMTFDTTLPFTAMGKAGIPVDSGWQPLPRRARRNVSKRTFEGRKFRCRICNHGKTDGFSAYHKLKMHVNKEHPEENIDLWTHKKYLCDQCGAGFASKPQLRVHINLHTGARPYSCDICHKSFRSQYLCRDHRLRHFPPTHTCSYCGKMFKSFSNCRNHEKIHIGIKNYDCKLCGKCFLDKTKLNEHVRGVHLQIRRVKRKASDSRISKRPRVEEIATEKLEN